MNRSLRSLASLALALVSFAPVAARAQGKPAPVVTTLTSAQSPALDASQREKAARLLLPDAPARPELGARPTFTAFPPVRGLAPRSKSLFAPQANARAWSVSPALGRVPRPEWTGETDLVAPPSSGTSRPATDAERARAQALAAEKLARFGAPAHAGAVKPAPVETREPARALTPEQKAKAAAAVKGGGR